MDLNCFLFGLKQTLSTFFTRLGDQKKKHYYAKLASNRRTAIESIFWNERLGFYYDFNYKLDKQSSVFSAAGVAPLFVEASNQTQAASVKDTLVQSLLKSGGLSSTPLLTGQQWDSPNGWAPLQYLAVKGLQHYGFGQEANEIKKRWLSLIQRRFAHDKKLLRNTMWLILIILQVAVNMVCKKALAGLTE